MIAFGTNAKFGWYKGNDAVDDSEINTVYASKKLEGTYQMIIKQSTYILMSEESVVSVNPSTDPGKVQVWIYDNPNPGSLAAVKAAFDAFRMADQI